MNRRYISSHFTAIVVAVSVLCILAPLPGSAIERSIRRVEDFTHTSGKLGDYKALVIGINEYADPEIPDLASAENDAREIARVLKERYNFKEPKLLLSPDATRSGIIIALRDLVTDSTADDSIIIYFAGHGDKDNTVLGGWWLPADAKARRPDTYVDNSTVQKIMAGMKARHVLLISDSCFAGTFFGAKRLAPAKIDNPYYLSRYSLKSRFGMTSGNLTPVADSGQKGHSIFAYFLLQALENPLKSFFTSTELHSRIAPVISNNAEQIPMFGPIKYVGDEDGRFVFVSNLNGGEKPDEEVASLQQKISQDERLKRAFDFLYQYKIDTAISEFRALADEGHPVAQGYMAQIWNSGLGNVEKDPNEAAQWGKRAINSGLEKLATQGDSYAQAALGNLLRNGHGINTDDEEALRWYLKSAESGNLYAYWKIGRAYQYGSLGLKANKSKAEKWLKKASEKGYVSAKVALLYLYLFDEENIFDAEIKKDTYQIAMSAANAGHATAQMLLGWMYQQGKAVEQNDTEAVKWYRLAAEQGDSYAQTNMGHMCKKGRGVEQSDAEAVKWYRLAADHGNREGQTYLGWMYDKGKGVEQSDTEAVKWYRLSAEQGDSSAQTILGHMYRKGRGVEQSDAEAVKWYRLAADHGNREGQTYLGWMYDKGKGVEQSDTEAVKWYRLSAEQGDSSAQTILGHMYRKGRGVEQSHDDAVRWYRLGAENGNSEGQLRLAWHYEHGEGVAKNIEEAVNWYKKSASHGNEYAISKLVVIGFMYGNGNGVDQNSEKAVELFRIAADQGNAEGQWRLAWHYEHGEGVAKDIDEAVKWYRLSAEQGDDYAKERLEDLTD